MDPKSRRLTPREEREANRTRAEVAALAALAFLWWQRRESGLVALASALAPPQVFAEVRRNTIGTIAGIRERGAAEGVRSAKRQLPTLAIAAPTLATIRGFQSAATTAGTYAKDWTGAMEQAVAEGATKPQAAAAASKALQAKAETIATTEASQGHALAKRKAVEEAAKSSNLVALERWVTEFGPNTCHICEFADGETIRLGDDFAEGIPGAVHPRCKCTSIYLYETPETAWLLTS